MSYLGKNWIFRFTITTFFICLLPIEVKAQSMSQLRFLSYIIRDHPPSFGEIRKLQNKEKTPIQILDEWLSSESHYKRMERYFRDMFGYDQSEVSVAWQFVLRKKWDEDHYYIWTGDHRNCEASDTVESEAWWLEAGEKVKICAQDVSDKLFFMENDIRKPCDSRGMGNLACGCGPKLIQCIPRELEKTLRAQLDMEFSKQAVKAYAEDGTWSDIFISDKFYGSRLMYWKYLSSSKMSLAGMEPSAEEWKTLMSLPIEGFEEAYFPIGEPRAGLITSPAF